VSLKSILAAAVAALALTGCEGRVQSPACPPGKLCMNIGNMADPLTLDPSLVSTVQASSIVSDMFMGLLADDPKAEAVPGMAESWTTSPDGLVWTFKLRADARWSDGAPVTAADFVFGLQHLIDPKTAAEYAYLAYLIRNAEAVGAGKLPPEALGAKAPDPRTLEITLSHPAPYLPELLRHTSFYPLPAHVVRKWGPSWTDPAHIVTNGPFKLVSWKIGDRVTLVKNPMFYDAANVCLDELHFFPTVDSVAGERRVLKGELDANVDIQSNRIPYLRRKAPAYVRTNTWLGVDYIAFNMRLKTFQDRRVRRALSMAIDREFITGKLLGGGNRPAYAFTPPGVANYPGASDPDWSAWPLEKRQAEARRLLAEAGYSAQRPLRVSIKQRNTSDPMLIMPAIQADWRAVGVEVQLEPNETQIAYASYRVGDFEVADSSWIADYNDPLTFLALLHSKTGSQNYSAYTNPAYDALIDRSDQEADPLKRAAILRRAEKMMAEDAPVAPVYYYISKNLVAPGVTGWIENLPDYHRRRWVCFKDAEARRRAGR
jgi:oligopeptide transport system substrate-binding protein